MQSRSTNFKKNVLFYFCVKNKITQNYEFFAYCKNFNLNIGSIKLKLIFSNF